MPTYGRCDTPAVMLPRALHDTLARLGDVMRRAQDDWWIIGSAAVAVHGAADVAVRDVDVLLGETDARQILPSLGLAIAPGADDVRFRSAIFATETRMGLPIEFMAGFTLTTTAGRHAIRPRTRERVAIGAVDIFVPSRVELADLLTSFGRPKDIRRARLLVARG